MLQFRGLVPGSALFARALRCIGGRSGSLYSFWVSSFVSSLFSPSSGSGASVAVSVGDDPSLAGVGASFFILVDPLVFFAATLSLFGRDRLLRFSFGSRLFHFSGGLIHFCL